MDLAERFRDLQNKARQELSGVANTEATERLARIVRITQECEGALTQIRELEGLAGRLDSELHRKPNSVATGPPTTVPLVAVDHPRKNRSGKAEGKEERKYLLQKAQQAGAPLYLERGRIYRTANGKRVGIGFATEDRRGDLWWLGIPEEALDVVILLCKAATGERLYFVLPSEFMSKVRPFLSTNRSDLIFHVRRSGTENFELVDAPQSGLKVLNQYRDRFDLLG
jgi:hypothetical protein